MKISLANAMKNAARDRAILMHSIASLSDPFEQQQNPEDFYHGAAAFTNARLQLEGRGQGLRGTPALIRIFRRLGWKA